MSTLNINKLSALLEAEAKVRNNFEKRKQLNTSKLPIHNGLLAKKINIWIAFLALVFTPIALRGVWLLILFLIYLWVVKLGHFQLKQKILLDNIYSFSLLVGPVPELWLSEWQCAKLSSRSSWSPAEIMVHIIVLLLKQLVKFKRNLKRPNRLHNCFSRSTSKTVTVSENVTEDPNVPVSRLSKNLGVSYGK